MGRKLRVLHVYYLIVPKGYAMTFEFPVLSPPRTNPDGTLSTKALHAAEEGRYTLWTAAYADLDNRTAVDLRGFVGFSIWARSAGKAGTTVKGGFADYGSFDQVADSPKLCDDVDTSGPNACFDDYAAKIYLTERGDVTTSHSRRSRREATAIPTPSRPVRGCTGSRFRCSLRRTTLMVPSTPRSTRVARTDRSSRCRSWTAGRRDERANRERVGEDHVKASAGW